MTIAKPASKRPRLTRAIAELFPAQGQWSEEEYLELSDRSNRLIELTDHKLEVLAMPTDPHQHTVGELLFYLRLYLQRNPIGVIRIAPLPVRLWPGKFREPDLVFLLNAHTDRITTEYWGVPDLVIEVHPPSSHDRDKKIKREEYAQAAIPEYWMVDTDAKTIEVYRLQLSAYALSARYGIGDQLTSELLPGFELNVADAFAKE